MSFNLYMFENDYEKIRDFVLGYTDIETGGDLFGLWKANGDPVVQLIIGPGQNSRRTSVSFHQDTEYLARVGTYVNSNFMLCHIGSWHSHHQLSLKQPSAGDRSTVCNNFPKGLKRYIMIIANITRDRRQSVVIHPYMFTQGGHVCSEGRVKFIPEQNPFCEDGNVLRCIVQGQERPAASSEAYVSAAPAGYHNRPSTQSKLRGQTTASFETNPTHERSNSPKKVDSNQHRSVHQYDYKINTKHQNYFSTEDTSAGRYSPMDVEPMDTDPPHNNFIPQQQQRNRSEYHDNSPEHLDNIETQQWYETEKGGAIVREIHEEVTNKMAGNVDYHRDASSKDLTMKFSHAHQDWLVMFPKSFPKEPAAIRNETGGRSKSSKNILQDIRKMCCCGKCQTLLQPDDPQSSVSYPSSSKRDPSPVKCVPSPYKRDPSPTTHHSPPRTPTKRDRQSSRSTPYPTKPRPGTGRRSESPSQPWYNTTGGKAIVERIKTELCAYLSSTTNSGKVETRDTNASKELSFYHFSRAYVVEFRNNVTLKFLGKIKTLNPPYDVVSVLIESCPCAECRSRKRSSSPGRRRTRPNSRYAEITQRSPTRASPSTPSPKFFSSENGEKQFKRIFTDISTLNAKNVEIQRNINSRKIEVNFEHNRRKWRVIFPFMFPDDSASVMYRNQRVSQGCPVSVEKGDVIRAIKKNCLCSSCTRYHY